ncbi:MAG TPA: hypothetical protein VFI29_23525 [Hanamia sp.]|nr:hypothetical protein [Hanamia sp.]
MKKKLILICLFTTNILQGYSQHRKANINNLGVSFPIIWNHSEGTYYSLGSPRHPDGTGVSYGLNINYSRTIYKDWFAIFGVGYFKQVFGIKRPFNYVTPDGTKPVVYTESYSYYNINLFLGIGYNKMLNKKLFINGKVFYNSYHSFKQRYSQKYFPGVNEIYKKNLYTGSTVNTVLGIGQFISTKISIGIGIDLPFYTKWNQDEIFYHNYYSNDEQQIAKNKFSIGSDILLKYYF